MSLLSSCLPLGQGWPENKNSLSQKMLRFQHLFLFYVGIKMRAFTLFGKKKEVRREHRPRIATSQLDSEQVTLPRVPCTAGEGPTTRLSNHSLALWPSDYLNIYTKRNYSKSSNCAVSSIGWWLAHSRGMCTVHVL